MASAPPFQKWHFNEKFRILTGESGEWGWMEREKERPRAVGPLKRKRHLFDFVGFFETIKNCLRKLQVCVFTSLGYIARENYEVNVIQ